MTNRKKHFRIVRHGNLLISEPDFKVVNSLEKVIFFGRCIRNELKYDDDDDGNNNNNIFYLFLLTRYNFFFFFLTIVFKKTKYKYLFSVIFSSASSFFGCLELPMGAKEQKTTTTTTLFN